MADLVDRILAQSPQPGVFRACEGCAAGFVVFIGQATRCPQCGGPGIRELSDRENARVTLGRSGSPVIMRALSMTDDELRTDAAERGLDAGETSAFLDSVHLMRDIQRLALEAADA